MPVSLIPNTERVRAFDESPIEQFAGKRPLRGGVLVLAYEIVVTVAISIPYRTGQYAIPSHTNTLPFKGQCGLIDLDHVESIATENRDWNYAVTNRVTAGLDVDCDWCGRCTVPMSSMNP